MAITANDVKTLRERTNAPMMECKTALNESAGDMEKAIEWLRKKAGSKIGTFAARETAEGRIAVFIDPVTKVGALAEVRCETAPVAKTDQFILLANDVVKQIALKNPADVEALLKETCVDHPGRTIADRVAGVHECSRVRAHERP